METSKVKTEQDWLKLSKNIPKDDFSLNDPNVHPRLIHRDGSLCHSKSAWASLNKKPPLKDFKLLDLFSDNEDADNQEIPTTSNTSVINTENIKNPTQSSNTDMARNDKDTTTTKIPVHTENNIINTSVTPKQSSDSPEAHKNKNEAAQTSSLQNKKDPVLANAENTILHAPDMSKNPQKAYEQPNALNATNDTFHKSSVKDVNTENPDDTTKTITSEGTSKNVNTENPDDKANITNKDVHRTSTINTECEFAVAEDNNNDTHGIVNTENKSTSQPENEESMDNITETIDHTTNMETFNKATKEAMTITVNSKTNAKTDVNTQKNESTDVVMSTKNITEPEPT